MYSFYEILKNCKTMANFMFEKRFTGDNVQGACGMLTIDDFGKDEQVENQDCRELITDFKTNLVFYKYGNNGYNCTLARQEFVVAENLMRTCSHIPNFLRPILYIKNHFVLKSKCDNPFDLNKNKSKNNIACVDVVIFEYINYSATFLKILKNKTITPNFVDSIIMQVCLAVICAQQNSGFVHNDLHANNIVLIKCDKNLKLLYRVNICGKEKLFLVPTYGYIPIIIDYGYSYSDECENMSLECASADNYGLITYQRDKLSDFIRFFVVVCNNYNPKLSYNIRNILLKCPISMRDGWEKIIKKDTASYIENIFIDVITPEVFKKDKKFYLQQLQLLMRNIILPIKFNETYENVNLKRELSLFFSEWIDVDKWLTYNYEKIYVFREFLDSLRKKENVKESIHKSMYNILGKTIHVQTNWKLLNYYMNRCVGAIQNIMYDKINILNEKRKEKLYKELHSGEHMFMKIVDCINKKISHLYDTDIILLIDNISMCNSLARVKKEGEYKPDEIFKFFD